MAEGDEQCEGEEEGEGERGEQGKADGDRRRCGVLVLREVWLGHSYSVGPSGVFRPVCGPKLRLNPVFGAVMPKHPWAAIPAQRSSAAVLNVKVTAILAALVVAALSGVLALFVALTSDGGEVTDPGPGPRVLALARLVAEDFVDGRPTTAAVATGVDATFGRGEEPTAPLWSERTVALYGTETSSYSGRTYHRVTFQIQGDGRLLLLAVPVFDTSEGPVLASAPSLAPYHGSGTAPSPLNYLDLPTGDDQVPAPVRSVVERWAQAYVSDDGAALKELAGDGGDGVYGGLGGFELAGVQVAAAVPFTTVDDEPALVVSTGLLVSPTGANGFQAETTLDLLVEQADTQLPRVTAWGPAGSATDPTPIRPGQNRLPAP